jgi:hypothetical protein
MKVRAVIQLPDQFARRTSSIARSFATISGIDIAPPKRVDGARA